MRVDQVPEAMAPPVSGRKEAILEAATKSFATHGVKGSNLREIAADADVSLTLLSHYFGSKAMLLAAVVDAHHVVCRQGLDRLKSLVRGSPESLGLGTLVDAWLEYEFALYDMPSRSRSHYLRLLMRLHEDPEVDAETRLGLHCAEPLVIHGLRRIRPDLDVHAIDTAWVLSSASVYASILNTQELTEELGERPDAAIARTNRFVFAGLRAFLES